MKKIVLLLIIITNTVFAQDDIVTDRPDVTESALTIPFKSIQFETGITDYNKESVTLPEYLIRIGVSELLELRIENSYYKTKLFKGYHFSDLFLGVKIQLLKKEKVNVAFLSHVNLPEKERNDLLFVEKLLLSYTFNNDSEIGVNIGADGFNSNNNGQFVYAVAYGGGITDKLGFFIENFGEISKEDGLISFIDGGFSYLLKNRIQLDSKFGIDTQFFKEYFLGLGLSIRMIK